MTSRAEAPLASWRDTANAEHVRATIRQHVDDDTRAVVLDAETMPFVDVSAARMLEELAEDLRRDGVALAIARDTGQVRDVLRRTGPRRRSWRSTGRSRTQSTRRSEPPVRPRG